MSNKTTQKILRQVIRIKKPIRIIEFGCGLKSTFIIKSELARLKSGFLVSLEDNKDWYNKIKQYNDKYGEVIFSNFDLFNGLLCYDYKPFGIYDLVLIDGPDRPEKTLYLLKKFLNSSSLWLNDKNLCGQQSCCLLEYVWPYINHKTIIIVDGRVAAVYHYYQVFHNKIKIYPQGKPYKKPKIRFLKLRHRKHRLPKMSSCSIIRKVK